MKIDFKFGLMEIIVSIIFIFLGVVAFFSTPLIPKNIDIVILKGIGLMFIIESIQFSGIQLKFEKEVIK